MESVMKLYVGNLSFSTSEQRLREIFSEHGDVASATLVMDRETGRPRGFGFVEFASDEHGKAAMAALNGKNIDGRDLTVNEAKPREAGGGGGRGGFGGGGGGGGRGGFGGGGGGGGGGRGGSRGGGW
jgi:RNA recognition motif-containing protein